MPTVNAGVFTINYELFTDAHPGHDIQFGMDFTVTSTTGRPLTQLIFPATAAGNNVALSWNVDNHRSPGEVQSIIYSNAANGMITDTPRELIKPTSAAARTKFAVFLVDVENATVLANGIAFGYSINPASPQPATTFDGIQTQAISNEQKAVLIQRFSALKFA